MLPISSSKSHYICFATKPLATIFIVFSLLFLFCWRSYGIIWRSVLKTTICVLEGLKETAISSMGDWNVENTNQIFGRQSEQGYSSTHPDCHSPLGILDNYSHHYSYRRMDPYAINVKNEDQLGSIQFCHPDPNYDLNAAAIGYYDAGRDNADSHIPYISPSDREIFSPVSNVSANPSLWDPLVTGDISNHQFSQSTPVDIGGTTSDFSGNCQFPGYRVSYKRKYSEMFTGDYYIANMPTNLESSSSSSRLLQHEEASENGFHVITTEAEICTVAEYLDDVETQNAEAHHFLYNNYIGQFFHPSCFGWAGQHHVGNCDYWNSMNAVSHVYGTLDSMIVHMQEHKEAFTYGNPAFVLQPLPLSNHHQHLPYVPSMQAHYRNDNQYIQMIPYWSLASNLQISNAHSFVGDASSSEQNMQVHSQDQNFQTINPSHLSVSNVQTSYAHPIVDNADSVNVSSRPSQLIAEEANWSLPEEAEEYEDDDDESSSDSDEHSDLRLDIEDLSYEELLALEREMGDVNTGLSEDSILKTLKTTLCAPLALSLSLSSLLDERCVICLEGYEEHERIGIVDCGHNYHADCITEWLLIRNTCPICRTRALASG